MPASWVRLFYRKGSRAFPEGPELDRARARKVPQIIHEARALWHRCQACGAEGVWTPEWICWPRFGPRQDARGEGDDIYCSADCCRAENPDRAPPRRLVLDGEPMPQKMRRAFGEARYAREQLDREAKRYRQCPMPEWPGSGWCKWCAGSLDDSDDPRDAKRQNWHTKCLRLYNLHGGHLPAQQRYLIERDGRECAVPGCTRPGCEVDHRVPLWRVRHLAAMIRRAFYGPINLWLLCRECHAAKSKREAAERAQMARESGQLAEP